MMKRERERESQIQSETGLHTCARSAQQCRGSTSKKKEVSLEVRMNHKLISTILGFSLRYIEGIEYPAGVARTKAKR